MATDKLQEAITLIRSGDRHTGQRLLTEILNADPRNESAWLWMSALMTGEKQRFCLEKVLSINPNHRQAREQLAKLTSAVPPAAETLTTAAVMESPASSQSLPVDMEPEPESEAAPAPSAPAQGMPLPKVWLTPGKHLSNIIYLEGDILLAFDALPNKASDVLEEVRFGVTPKQFNELKNKFNLMNVSNLSLARVTSVTLFGDVLKVIGTDKSGKEKRVSATLNKENSEAVLKTIQERLGPEFQRITRPISRLQVLTSAAILLAITVGGTGFFWWFTRGLQAEIEAEGRMGGSARARGIATLLLLIGPNGFLCIGTVLLVIVVIAMISSLRKPPEETVLTRVVESETSH